MVSTCSLSSPCSQHHCVVHDAAPQLLRIGQQYIHQTAGLQAMLPTHSDLFLLLLREYGRVLAERKRTWKSVFLISGTTLNTLATEAVVVVTVVSGTIKRKATWRACVSRRNRGSGWGDSKEAKEEIHEANASCY